ncbi:MAG: amidase [Acidimicrobiales bacterium]
MDFLDETVADLAGRVRSGELSARELVSHALNRIEAVDTSVGAFVALDPEGAMEAALAVDEAVASGDDPGPLAGIPIAVKDLEDAAGLHTGKGLAAFGGRRPARADSALVARLKAAGCIVVGKTNTPALGHKADTTNLVDGATRNPWNLERSPGGSSGGSAAAIAAGMVPLATGSDGGGSIRIPSALCGLSGMKPSLGRVPSGGDEPPDWQHLSTKGPMARSITDVALALDAVIGPEQSDLRSLPMPEASWANVVRDPGVPLRVAWSPTLGYATPEPEVLEACEAAVAQLEELGAEVVQIDAVFDADPILTWVAMTGTYLRRTLQAAGALGGPDIDDTLQVLLDWTASLTAVELAEAEDECHRLNLRLVELFSDARLLVAPTVAGLAPLSGRPGLIAGEETPNWVQLTYPFNLTRSPAGTVPVGVSSQGTPIGLQVVGPQHADQVVLRAIAALEDALGLPDPPRL